jgi:hypothetical protein
MAPCWYTMLLCIIAVPVLTLWNRRVRSLPIALFLITLAINVSILAFNWGDYFPSVVEISILVGALATFLLLCALLSRLVPLIPVWEVREGQLARSLRRVGQGDGSVVKYSKADARRPANLTAERFSQYPDSFLYGVIT